MFELKLECSEDIVSDVSDALEALDALSVSVEDGDAGQSHEQALFGEPGMPPPKDGWQKSWVTALFATQAAAQEAADLLLLQDFGAQTRVLSVAPVQEQDWVRLTQSQFEPVPITPQFWIVPTWHEVPAAATEVLRLDPGLAFGTGTHPTTRMCLRWIAANAACLQGQRVLDYGAGSGILAIAAAKFGAAHLDAVDIDPAAVQACAANAVANHVAGPHFVSALPDAVQGLQGAYGVVLANILATPLKVLAPLLCSHLAAGAPLVLAGILSRQTEELQAAYAPYLNGGQLEVADEQEGWVLLVGCMDAGV